MWRLSKGARQRTKVIVVGCLYEVGFVRGSYSASAESTPRIGLWKMVSLSRISFTDASHVECVLIALFLTC